MKLFKNKMLSEALILSATGIITKLIGAFYRVPLTNLLGAEGMGLYQMVFPLYTILLTFSSTGAPSGISKLIASGESPEVALKSSLKLFSILGLLGSVLMAGLCYPVSLLQGNKLAWICYLLLSPSVLLVSVISCFRGYFQGLVNMKPTGFSQIVEQATKMLLGLAFAYLVKGPIALRAGVSVLAVTLSECFGLLYIFLIYKKRGRVALKGVKTNVKGVFKTVVPIMLSSLTMPVIRTVDSFLILNLVKYNATQNYGLYSGVIESLVGVPVTMCYSLALTSIPIIAKQKTTAEKCGKAFFSIGITLIQAVLYSLAFIFLSNFIINLLYNGLSEEQKAISIQMLKLSSVSVLLLPTMQSLIASVNAMGKTKVSLVALAIAGVVKIVSSLLLLPNAKIGVYGAIYSDISCYFVACFIILGYIIYVKFKDKKGNLNERNYHYRSWQHRKRLVGGR